MRVFAFLPLLAGLALTRALPTDDDAAAGLNLDLELDAGQLLKFGKITKGDPKDFSYVHIPEFGAPCDMAVGPDGAMWVQFLFAEKIARIDPDSQTVTEQYDIPFSGTRLGNETLDTHGRNKNSPALVACVLRLGNDGNLYAANGLRNQLVKLDFATKAVSVFTPPGLAPILGNLQPFNDLWGAPEGMYFSQSSANLISLFDYHTHEIQSWEIPTPLSLPLGMRLGPDKRLYFTELLGQKIGALDYKTGHIQEYPLPVPALLGPAVLRVQTDDRYLWFTGALSDSIGRLDVYSGEFKAYPNSAPLSYLSVPSEITNDAAGCIWFDTWTQDLLHRLDPRTGKQTHISVPGHALLAPVSLPLGFSIGINYLPGKNQIYFTQALANRVGIYQIT